MDSQESQNNPQDLENTSASSAVTTAVDEPVDMTASTSDTSNDSAEIKPSDTKPTEIEQLLATMHGALKDLAEHFSTTVNHIGTLLSSSQAHPSQVSAEAEPSAMAEVTDTPTVEAESSAMAEVTDTPTVEAESPPVEEEEDVTAEQVPVIYQDGGGDISTSEMAVEVEEPAESADADPVALASADEVVVEASQEEVPETLANLATEAGSDDQSLFVSAEEPATAAMEEPATDTAEEPATDTAEEPATAAMEEPATAAMEEPATAAMEEPATDTMVATGNAVGEETPSPIEVANETDSNSPSVSAETAPTQQDSTD